MAYSFLLCTSFQSVAQGVLGDPSPQQIIDALKPMPPRPNVRNLKINKAATADTNPTETSINQAATTTDSTATSQNVETSAKSPSIDIAIQFDFGSSKVSNASLKTLQSLAIALADSQLASLSFRVEGHTDSIGTADANKKLSLARAEEVRRVLVLNQIAPERLLVEGKGSSEPLDATRPAAAVNRRVRFISLSP